MTVQQLRDALDKLIDEGHGDDAVLYYVKHEGYAEAGPPTPSRLHRMVNKPGLASYTANGPEALKNTAVVDIS